MRARLIGAAIWAPIVVGAAWRGGLLWVTAVAVAAAIAAVEAVQLLRHAGLRPSLLICALMAPALVVAASRPDPELAHSVLVAGVAAACLVQFARPADRRSLADWASTVALPIYVGVLLGYTVEVRLAPDGLLWMAVLLALVWTNDSIAYLAGRQFGRRPLAATLSPHKTQEGALAATVATVVLAALLPWIGLWLPAWHGRPPVASWPLFLGLGLAVSIAAPLGDLAKSFLKRSAGVKDSGRLIPGHGGLLDRADSLMFAAPVVYWFSMALGRLS